MGAENSNGVRLIDRSVISSMFTRVNPRCAHHVRPPGKALSGSGYGSARLVRQASNAACRARGPQDRPDI
jgi:hypothetical protein